MNEDDLPNFGFGATGLPQGLAMDVGSTTVKEDSVMERCVSDLDKRCPIAKIATPKR